VELQEPWIGLELLSWVRSHCWAWRAWLVDQPEALRLLGKPIMLDWVIGVA
jgi:hypothetical protein